MGIGSNRMKYIQSLKLKKFRDKHGVFIAEGDKIVRELLQSHLHIQWLCALPQWIDQSESMTDQHTEVLPVSQAELERISTLKTPNQVLAVVKKPSGSWTDDVFSEGSILVLDNLQDPGNMGTIIRTADWFGIRNIICSPTTADLYNPKVIQATMGSFMRVRIHYTPLPDFFSTVNKALPVYGASLEGISMYEQNPRLPGILVIGNESAGISQGTYQYISCKVKIPAVAARSETASESIGSAESLNASVAAGILMAWMRGSSQSG